MPPLDLPPSAGAAAAGAAGAGAAGAGGAAAAAAAGADAALGSAAFLALGLASLGSAFLARDRRFGLAGASALAAGDAVVSSDMDDPFFGARRTRSKDSDHIGYRGFRRTYSIKPKRLT